VLLTKAKKPAAEPANGLREDDLPINSLATPKSKVLQPLQAKLDGNYTCSAAGFTGRGNTPVLVLCGKLIAAGLNPDQAMEVYRGGILALRVRSIGEGAKLRINSKGTRFVRRPTVRAGLHVIGNDEG